MRMFAAWSSLYGPEYFRDRAGNNPHRLAAFEQEARFLSRFTSFDGTVLDVGCATGEFLEHIGWRGPKYGLEISGFAAAEARKRGIHVVKGDCVPDGVDVVVYRGTIQHLDSPFRSIEKATTALRLGGHLFFLATPNINSVYYRVFLSLPALDAERNFYLPSDQSLVDIGKMCGLRLVAAEYPYLTSPYASPLRDTVLFLCKVMSFPLRRISRRIQFPFWGNMMNLAFRKQG